MTAHEPLTTTLAAWAHRLTFSDLPQDVVDATRLRILDVMGLALAGADTPFGRATRAAAVAMSPPGPCRDLRPRRTRRRGDSRVRQRRVRPGARVRRHAQRIDRPHEQSGRRRRARVVGDRRPYRAGISSRRSPSATKSPAGSAASRRDSFTSAAFIPRDCSRRSASRIWRAGCWVSTPHRWRRPPASAAASHRGSWNAGSTARTRNSCTRDGRRKAASRPPISRARA